MKCSHRCVYLIRPLGGQTSSGDKKRHWRLILSGSSHAVTRVMFIRGVKQQSSGLNVNRTLLKVFVSVNFVRFSPRDQIAGILSVFVVNIVKEKFHGFFSVTFLSVISRKINQTRHICSSRKKKTKLICKYYFHPGLLSSGFRCWRWVTLLVGLRFTQMRLLRQFEPRFSLSTTEEDNQASSRDFNSPSINPTVFSE